MNTAYNPFNVETMNLDSALYLVRSLGYDVSRSDTFTYTRDGLSVRAYYLIDSETGLGAFNINARRDDRFNKLQEFRYWIEVYHGKTLCEF